MGEAISIGEEQYRVHWLHMGNVLLVKADIFTCKRFEPAREILDSAKVGDTEELWKSLSETVPKPYC